LLFAVEGLPQAQKAYRHNTARNLWLLERAGQLLDGARARGLPLLPWKGAALAAPLWGDPGVRPMSDLDFLAPPDALDGIAALCESLGFHRTYGDRARFSREHGHDLSFTLDEPYLIVEIHWRLHHDLGGDASVDAIFARAQDGLPSWSDSLFGVGLHAATHGFGEHLFWPLELALLAQKAGGVDDALSEANRRQLHVAFAAALTLGHELIPSLLPEMRIAPLRRAGLYAALGSKWWAQPPSRLRILLAKTVLTDAPGDAARELARKLRLRGRELQERARAART
jgi:hypothetical protein